MFASFAPSSSSLETRFMPATAPTPRKATVLQRVLLVVLSPIVFLLIFEGVLRVSGISTDVARNKNFKVAVPTWLLADPGWVQAQQRRIETQGPVRAEDVAWFSHFQEARFIGIKLKPHVDAHVVNPFNNIEVAKQATFHLTSNGDGFRGPEFSKKRPAVLRVVSIGDSSTFGWGVDPEYTYQEQLATRLATNGRPAEVFNLGMPGTTSRHGLGVLDHIAAGLQPDVVVISFGANDARLTLVPAAQELAMDDTWLGAARWTMLELKTFQLVRKLIFNWYDPFKTARQSTAGEGRALVKAVPVPDYIANLRKMRGRASVLGAKTVFMSVCTPDEYVDAMRQTAKAIGVPFVDVGQIFREKADGVVAGEIYPEDAQFYKNLYGPEALQGFWRYWVTTDGCHPNRVGHKLVADAVADAVRTTFGR
jgi:lysophospholipase L1-like esterase